MVALLAALLAALGSIGPWVVGLGMWSFGALAVSGADLYGEQTGWLSLAAAVSFFFAASLGNRTWSIIGTILVGLVTATGLYVLINLLDELDGAGGIALIGWGLMLLIASAGLGLGCGIWAIASPRHVGAWLELPRRMESSHVWGRTPG